MEQVEVGWMGGGGVYSGETTSIYNIHAQLEHQQLTQQAVQWWEVQPQGSQALLY